MRSKHEQPRRAPQVWRKPSHFLAFGFGSGLARFAPGTWGTVAAIPLYLVMAPLTFWAYLGVTALLFGIGVWLCEVTSRDLGVHDHPGIVWDEIVGYLIAMAAAPVGWAWMLAGFVLFRLFDIWKPWPIRRLDRQVSGGFGIMVDDVLAGVYAAVLLALAAWLLGA
ncbi:phosphatidylglycerophosphatase A [Ectothiorhodospiraceae bacterium 2226]|nr:phosphatidylglycerophosphatase A [Ectothiorhodospiraceae bacterium 2226]